jgi:hypothetical protein
MPTASDLCDQSVTVAQVGLETSSVLVLLFIHATTLQPMTVVTQPLAPEAYRSRISPLLPLPVWQVSPSTVLPLHSGQCLPLLIFVTRA